MLANDTTKTGRPTSYSRDIATSRKYIRVFGLLSRSCLLLLKVRSYEKFTNEDVKTHQADAEGIEQRRYRDVSSVDIFLDEVSHA